jgi:hypothetical protein
MRMAEFLIFIGTNGTGKSFNQKKFLPVNNRNLIIPANGRDKAWHGFTKLTPKFRFETDPNDPKQKRQHKVWYIPGINSFKGVRVLDVDVLETDEDCLSVFRAVCHRQTGFIKGGLFVDDFKNYIFTKGTLPRYVRNLFNDRRHREVDIFMASHSMQDINGDMLQFNPKIVIFNTTLPPNDTVMGKIANSAQLMETYERVRHKATKNQYYYEIFIPS